MILQLSSMTKHPSNNSKLEKQAEIIDILYPSANNLQT
jgi:hypothetical protein